jgi:hypothetical protein
MDMFFKLPHKKKEGTPMGPLNIRRVTMKETIYWISHSAEPQSILWKIPVLPDTFPGKTHENSKPILKNPTIHKQKTPTRGGFT